MIKRFYFLLSAFLLAAPLAQAFEFNAYGGVGASAGDSHHQNSTFFIKPLDLYASHRVDDKTRAFVEILIEEDHGEYEADMERLWMDRKFTPNFSARMGRLHTALGLWNRNYHHGSLFMDTIERPFFLQFEDGEESVLPMHMVGVELDLHARLDSGIYRWQLAVGNGPDMDSFEWTEGGAKLNLRTTMDFNNRKMAVSRISMVHFASKVQLGAFALLNDIVESSTQVDTSGDLVSGLEHGDKLFEQMVAGVDMRWTYQKFYAMSELYYLRSEDRMTNPDVAPVLGTHNNYFGYLQMGLSLSDKWTLSLRYERMKISKNDSYFILRNLPGQEKYVLGLRYEIDASTVLRLGLSRGIPELEGEQAHSQFVAEWAFLAL